MNKYNVYNKPLLFTYSALKRFIYLPFFWKSYTTEGSFFKKKKHVSPTRCYTTAIKERTRGIILENVGRKDFPDFLRNYPVSREDYTTKHIETAYISSLSFLKGRFYKAKQTKKNVQHTLQKYLCTDIIEY